MNRVLTSTIALTGSAVGAWALTHNYLAPALAAAAVGLVLHAKYVSSKPKEQFGETLRGTRVDGKTKRGKRGPADQITIGGIPIPREAEPQHILLAGSPGTGKTVVCESIMDVVRARGQRAVVYDSTGEFISHYYRPDRDVILSPIDQRSAPWSPWSEGADPYSLLNLATAFIPESNPDKFWGEAGRAILQSILQQTADMEAFSNTLFRMELGELYDAIVASGYGGYIGPPNQFASARSVACVYCRPLTYLPELTAKPFSIREWIRNEKNDSWLFVSSRADVHESIRPLISMWLGIAVQSCMSLPPDRNRRLWFILDELPTLQKLPSLDLALAGGRKYGIACVLGVQTIAQPRDTYGRDAAAAILSHPATRLTLRVGDSETATYLSDSLGQRHTIRKVTSESQNSGGGGQSTSEQHSIEAAILPSEILALPNLIGYLRVPNDPVIKRIALRPRDRATLVEPYQDRALCTPPPVPQAQPVANPAALTRTAAAPGLDVDGSDLPEL